MMAVHGSKGRDVVKWVVLIAFLLLSTSVTSSHQNTDPKITVSASNETKGVHDANNLHAKVSYKHKWPVRASVHPDQK